MNNAHEILSGRGARTISGALNSTRDAMRKSFMRRPGGQFYQTVVVVWLTLSVASVVLATATWVRLSRQLNAASQAVAIRLETDSILQTLLEAENGQRGFVITGNPNFLELLKTSATNLPSRFELLINLSRSDPPLLKRVLDFRGLAEASLNYQQRVVLAAQEHGQAAASAIVATGRGKEILDTIRRDVGGLGAARSALVFNQGTGAHAQLTRASLTSLAAGILGLGAGMFAFALSRLTVKHQERERELIEAKFEADRRNQEKTAFLANVSHEIRTPMNAILGFGELLENDRLNHKQRGYIECIRRSASSLLQLINDMLDVSKIEAGAVELRPEPTDPREICHFIQTMFAEPAARKHLNLNWKMAEGLPRSLLLDPVRLRQILVNLVGNAVKFTDHGSIELHIKWEDQVPGELLTLLIDVKDTGVGIPADRLEAVFNPFVQAGAHPEKERQGTGLGLAIVKRLAELMGGSVRVTSEVKRGSLFQVRLPDVAISGRLPASEQLMRVAPTDFNVLQPATVLGVDDNETNRQLLQAMLSGSHHRLLLASNGQQAIEMARQTKPDLILLDLRMPEMDGRNVLQALSEIQALALTPVIILTASGVVVDQSGIKTWVRGYLHKPFSSQDLLDEMALFLPWFQQAGAPLDQRKVPAHARSPSAFKSTTGRLETLAEENDRMFGVLTHDLKSSLAGVVMSSELLLEQAACVNGARSRRLVTEILNPGRLLLARVKAFSADSTSPPGKQSDGNHLPKICSDNFGAQCGRMLADAQELRRELSRRAEGRSVQLADNIVRSCTELTTSVEKFASDGKANKVRKPICLDLPEAAAQATRDYRRRAQRPVLRFLTPTYSAYGLSGY